MRYDGCRWKCGYTGNLRSDIVDVKEGAITESIAGPYGGAK